MISTVDLLDHLEPGSSPEDSAAVTGAFERALAAIKEAKGGTLQIPPGTWHLQRGPTLASAAIVLNTAGTILRGAGIRATRLRLIDREPAAVINILSPGVTIERLSVVGNADALPESMYPHGIMVRAQPTFFAIRDVHVENIAGYGIFLSQERHVDDTFTNIVLHNVSVARCGNDGIDFKLRSDRADNDGGGGWGTIRAKGPRAFLRNITVEDHSLFFPDNAPGRRAGENGIDIRGQVHMENIEVLRVAPPKFGKPGAGGIAFRDARHGRQADGHNHQGAGAEWSTLDGYYVSISKGEPPRRYGHAIRIRNVFEDPLPVAIGAGSQEKLR